MELGVQLEKEAQLEVEEYVHSTETNNQKILQEKQSKLNAFIDAATLNDEHKEQVFDLLPVSCLVDNAINVLSSCLNNNKLRFVSLNKGWTMKKAGNWLLCGKSCLQKGS